MWLLGEDAAHCLSPEPLPCHLNPNSVQVTMYPVKKCTPYMQLRMSHGQVMWVEFYWVGLLGELLFLRLIKGHSTIFLLPSPTSSLVALVHGMVMWQWNFPAVHEQFTTILCAVYPICRVCCSLAPLILFIFILTATFKIKSNTWLYKFKQYRGHKV